MYARAEPTKNAIANATPRLTAMRGVNMRCSIPSLHVADFGHLHHRLGGEERFVDRTHIDVPALTLGSFEPGQVAHRDAGALNVGGRNAYDVFALERIDCDLRVRHRPIAIRQPGEVVAEQLTPAIVSVDVRLEPHFRVHIDYGLGFKRFAVVNVSPRLRTHDVHMAHLPTLGARTGAAVGGASHFRRMLCVDG